MTTPDPRSRLVSGEDSKDALNACIDLANLAQTRFQGRREIEWKVTIGVWALLAGASIFARADNLRHAGAFAGAACAFLGYLWWMFNSWKSNYKDKLVRDHYLHAADELLAYGRS